MSIDEQAYMAAKENQEAKDKLNKKLGLDGGQSGLANIKENNNDSEFEDSSQYDDIQ